MEPNTNHRQCDGIFHGSEKRIKLNFKYNPQHIELVTTIPGSRWSKNMNAWHVPDNDVSKTYIKRLIDNG